ncbi:cell division protein ZipA [Colwellia sp. E2M01]|uniref:cell division protein ZipA n=1 Tax=Colwellia sp. E2M01 TaxID=2841561 RepID=UPI001C093CF9|nr:cell division protein ZipA [Colwellia sp. E2M01]MBU2871740.1 cell division protein ZipA [Colwellia sp. E2M01]
MEDNFRNVLIILSAIVITAIFIHGLWTIRKQKNPYKLKTSKNKVEPVTRDFDQKGFDQDGVSQVKISKNENMPAYGNRKVNKTNFSGYNTGRHQLGQSQRFQQRDILANTGEINLNETQLETERSQAPNNMSNTALDNAVESDWFKDELNTVADTLSQPINNKPEAGQHETLEPSTESNSHSQFTKDELGDALTPNQAVTTEKPADPVAKPVKKAPANIEPVYEQPVSRAKPERAPVNRSTSNRAPTKAELKRDQMEIDFDNQPNVKPIKPLTPKEKTPKEKAPKEQTSKEQLEPQVIILSVVMPQNQQMLGAALLPSLLTLGLKYGEMNIFHRHQDNAGNGKVTFSLANIMNPGSFDLDNMETFATQGVSLFMTLPNAGDPFAVFEQMLKAAKQLAQEFNGQLLDDKRNVMTKQTEQHYVSKIREFARLSRIARAE